MSLLCLRKSQMFSTSNPLLMTENKKAKKIVFTILFANKFYRNLSGNLVYTMLILQKFN